MKMSRSSLSESVNQLNSIVSAFEAGEEVSIADYDLAVDSTKQAIDQKAWLIKHLDAESRLLKERVEDLKLKAKKIESFLTNLKGSIARTVEMNPHIDFQGMEYKLKVVNNGGKQAVTLAFGAEFREVRKVVDPDYFAEDATEKVVCWVLKEGIEDKVREGVQVKGLELQPRGKSLRIL